MKQKFDAALGAVKSARVGEMRQGYRHGTQERTLTTSSVRLLFRAQGAASLLQPFSLERVTPSAASRLVPLADGYGLDWCVTTFESWTSEKRQGSGGARHSVVDIAAERLPSPL